jgi:hypothetical protein
MLPIQDSASLAETSAQIQPPPETDQHQPTPPQSEPSGLHADDDPIPASAPPSMAVADSEVTSLELLPDVPDAEEQPAKRRKLDEDATTHRDDEDDVAGLGLDPNGDDDAMMHHDLPE